MLRNHAGTIIIIILTIIIVIAIVIVIVIVVIIIGIVVIVVVTVVVVIVIVSSSVLFCAVVDSFHFGAVWILSTRRLSVVRFVLRCCGFFPLRIRVDSFHSSVFPALRGCLTLLRLPT